MTRQPDFTGVRIKVERAKEHFRDLQARIEGLQEDNAYKAIPYDEPNTGDLVYKAKIGNQPPPYWSAIVGDCVHNLRSSLDLLVCEMLRAGDRKIERHHKFPVFRDETAYTNAFKPGPPGAIKGIPKCAVDLIKDAKPHEGPDNAFGRLHKLDIADKHHLLVPVGVVHRKIITTFRLDDFSDFSGLNHDPTTIIDGELVTPPHGITPVGLRFPLEDGAEIYRVPASLRADPRAQMHVYPELVIEVAFGEVEVVEGEPIIPTLHQLIQFVEGFIQLFPPLFSQESS